MAQYFNFKRLIEKYSVDLIAVIPSEGYYDFENGGEWQEGKPTEKHIRGAAINHRESKIFRSEGTLTGKDKALYTLFPLENALHGAKVNDGVNLYSIGDLLENGEFTGVWAYTLKYVSAFKETSPDYDISEEVSDLEQRLDGVLVEEEETQPDTDETDYAEELAKRLDGE